MEKAYVTWMVLVVAGFLLGLFVRMKTVLLCGGIAFAIALVAFMASIFTDSTLGLVLGWGLVLVPLTFGLATLGALLGNVTRTVFKSSRPHDG